MKRSWIRSDEIVLKGTTTPLSNWQHSSDPTKIDSTKIYPGGIELSAHGSRHNRGGADPIDYTQVMKLFLKSASPTLGTGGTLGAAVTLSPDTNFSRIVILGVKISIGGTFATGESITVRITVYFDDGTSAYIDKTYSATGDYELTESDLQSLWKDGVGITQIDVQAASSATSTSATVTVSVRGIQY